MVIDQKTGLVQGVRFIASPHCDQRPTNDDISLLVIHGISLPPGEFGGQSIEDLFLGCLDPDAHPYFKSISHLRVSAHAVIRRDGQLTQYVPFHQRAWHAGESSFEGRSKCNDYAIGIELEGEDELAYTDTQYQVLAELTGAIMQAYPKISQSRIVGHSDIAPGRKTDPGSAFDWTHYYALMAQA